MPVIDARELESPFEIRSDVCIVGAGAAGLTLAESLLAKSREVCVLEAGGFAADPETQSLHDVECAGYPIREDYMSRARYFGGTCNLWAGRAIRLSRLDIEDRPWLGLKAWPLSYEELERYYRSAAAVLGLPNWRHGEALPPGKTPEEEALFEDRKLSINVALWAPKPRRFGSAFRVTAKRNRHCTLLLHANVTEVVLDETGGRVERIEAATLDGRHVVVRAAFFVLAAGGLENARLLLVSRRHRVNGIGNEHDLVGRYYMDHPRAVYGTVRLERPVRLPHVLGLTLKDGKVQLGIALDKRVQQEEGLVNSYVTLQPELSNVAKQQYQTSISVAKVLLRRGHAGSRFDWSAMKLGEVKDMIYLLTPREVVPHAFYRSYVGLKRLLSGDLAKGRLTIVNYCEQLPNWESRVYLSTRRDRLGSHKLVVDWRIGSDERRSIARLHHFLDERFRRARIGQVESSVEEIERLTLTDASHHMGTTRMSDDPKHGVVNADCRVHGVANLFVAGSSTFPSCGNANPTWTIVALALRLADHIGALESGR